MRPLQVSKSVRTSVAKLQEKMKRFLKAKWLLGAKRAKLGNEEGSTCSSKPDQKSTTKVLRFNKAKWFQEVKKKKIERVNEHAPEMQSEVPEIQSEVPEMQSEVPEMQSEVPESSGFGKKKEQAGKKKIKKAVYYYFTPSLYLTKNKRFMKMPSISLQSFRQALKDITGSWMIISAF